MSDKLIRNIRITIEYDGTNYCGWQDQNHSIQNSPRKQKKSIQQVLEAALKKILREKVNLFASGRTDSGVHAIGQVAHFRTYSTIPLKGLQKALNSTLSADISITKISEVPLDFHSRFSAKSKIYRYTILNREYPSALSRNTVCFYFHPLNVNLMRKEARVLVGTHNFKSFQLTDKKKIGQIREIKQIKITKTGDLIHIDIEADGFLYNMARNIVGTLIEIGRGRFPMGSLKKILLSKNRRFAGPTAPAHGLCLLKVKY